MQKHTGHKRAFTLIELLIVIAVVAVLVAIAVPVMAGVRERSRRVVCMGTMRSFHVALTAYATNNDSRLPDAGFGNTNNHTITMKSEVHESLGGEYICPNLYNPFRGEPVNIFKGGSYQSADDYYLLGYNYLGGLPDTPWPLIDPAAAVWKSPQKITENPRQPVLTELNTWISEVYQITFAPHGRRGPIHNGGDSTNRHANGLAPNLIGAVGGHRCTLDGMIQWNAIESMQIHRAATDFNLFAYW